MGAALLALLPSSMGPLPEGMHTPILAFELARSAQEIETMFGPPASPERAAWVAAMNRGNLADYLFMALYGAYFWGFSRALAQNGLRTARLASRLALLPSLMDALENRQLWVIAQELGGQFDAPLLRLAWFTWSKWLLIALLLVLWIPSLWRLGMLARVSAIIAALTFVASAVAFFTRGSAAELMGLGTSVSLILTLFVLRGLLRARSFETV
jgi:hypothetical protein